MTAPTSRRRMTSMDASFLYLEKPTLPLHIGSTSVLDGPISKETLVGHMESRMHRIPRYRELAVFDSFNVGHPRWEDDPSFDVKRHIEEITLPEGSSYEDLMETISAIHSQMLPRDRPLWKIVLIHGMPGGVTGMCMLVHHCMVDGVSGIELLTTVSDLEKDVEPETPQPFTPSPPSSTVQRTRDAWRDSVESAMAQSTEAVRWAMDSQQQMRDMQAVTGALISAAPSLVQPAPATPFNRPVSGSRSYAVLALSFGEIRGVRGVLGGTINDVVLSALSGAMGAYLRGKGLSTERMELRAMVPVNVRTEADKTALGNAVSMLIAPLPVGILDPVERHKAVIAGMGRLKAANQAGGFALMTRLTEQVPPALQAFAGSMAPNGQSLFNMVCTNVPGPQVPLFVAGRQITQLWPLVPLSAGLGLNVCLASYNGVLYWGICADPKLVPDVGRVAELIRESFDQLKEAATAASAVPA